MKFSVRVQPRSSKEAVTKNADGSLRVYIRQAPAGGEANKSLIKALSAYYGVRRSEIKIIAGLKNRNKIVEIASYPLRRTSPSSQ